MGILEKEIKDEIRSTKIQEAVLKTIGAVGFLSVALLAPNALQVLGQLNLSGQSLLNKKKTITNSRDRLVDKGYLRYEKKGILSLTEKGIKKLKQFEVKSFQVQKPARWDKKWRILIFDIREERKSVRDKVRNTLISIGFVRLQDSVWVYPYDCEDLITLLKADFKVGKDLLYIIADRIEYDKVLRGNFGL